MVASTTTVDRPDASPLSARRGLLILLLLCGAQFLAVLDATIVNVALPSVQRALHFTPQNLQWVASGYALTFAGFLLLGGRAADRLGRRRVFVTGVLLFIAASLASGLAVSSGVLIAARLVQGLGGAIMSRRPCPCSPPPSRARTGPRRWASTGRSAAPAGPRACC